MMFPYMYEAQFLVEDGATPEQVDRALTDFGMAMGIFAVDDMAGLDVAWRVRQELRPLRGARRAQAAGADTLYELGRLGQKTGKGWYRYDDGSHADCPIPRCVAADRAVRRERPASRRASSADEEIVERAIYALINEGARVLEDGLRARAPPTSTSST